MAWKSEPGETQERVSNFVEFGKLSSVGDTSEVRMRILGGDPTSLEEPASVWQHWLESRPYNCKGTMDCPVCVVRMVAKKLDPDGYKQQYPMNFRYAFNVAVQEDGKDVSKIFAFGNAVGKQLKAFAMKYGDLRGYDVTVQKRKTGTSAMKVEYNTFYEGPSERDVSGLELFDLTSFGAPASLEVLQSVAKGVVPVMEVEDRESPPVGLGFDLERVQAIVKAKKLDLVDFGIDINNLTDQDREVIATLVADAA